MRGVWTVSGFCFDAVCGRFGESTDRGGVLMAALVELLALFSVNFSRLTIIVLLFTTLGIMLVETFRVNLGSAVLETAFDNSEIQKHIDEFIND